MPNYRIRPEPVATSGDILAGDASCRARDRILLGQLAESGPRRQIWLDLTGEQVVAILGKRGTGKSYTLGVILEGLAAGQGTSHLAELVTLRAGLVLDIMDIFWSSQIPLTDDGSAELRRQFEAMRRSGYQSKQLSIDVWIPAGFESPNIDPAGINSLRLQACDLSLDDWGTLFDVNIYTEPRGMLIADAIQHVSIDGYSQADGSRILPKANFNFSDLLSCIRDDADVTANYQDVTRRSVRQRMTSYQNLALFGGEGTPLTDLLRPFRVSVLMLARLPDALKRVIVAVLLRRIARERRDASLAQKRIDLDSSLEPTEAQELRALIGSTIPRTWVLMDEAHVLAAAGESTVASEALVKFAKEGRNCGLSLAVATQQPSALDSRLMSQVETLIVHQLTSPDDSAVATRAMRSPPPEEILVDNVKMDISAMLRRLSQGEAAFSSGNAPKLRRTCILAVRARTTAHGGYEA
jgi:DNA helicase HerA-like ATPase